MGNPATYIQDSIDLRVVLGTIPSLPSPDLPAHRFRFSFHTFTVDGFLFLKKYGSSLTSCGGIGWRYLSGVTRLTFFCASFGRWIVLSTTLQRYKTGNEKTAGHLSVKPILRFVVSHFYSTFDPQILGSRKGVITRVSKAKA